jgi:hypothetical protein
MFGTEGWGAMLYGGLTGLFGAVLGIVILIRLGVVAFMASFAFHVFVQNWALTTDLSSPFFAEAFVGPIVLIAIASYAFKISLAGRPLFREARGPAR